MNNYRPGAKVDFQSNTYIIIKVDGDSLIVKRAGSSYPIEIPKSKAKLILEEGRSSFDINKSLNG